VSAPCDVSVCVPVYRSHGSPNLATLAAGMPAALGDLRGELVVALNGISAREAGVPASADTGADEPGTMAVRTVDLGVNRGVSPGWNAAAAAAHGDILVFCNDDVLLGARSLELLGRALRERPEAGVVGPVGTRWDLERAEHRSWLDLSGRPEGDVEACEVVSGFLFATRRETWEAAGRFDEAYAPASWEEVDFCTAVRTRLGLRCYAVAGVEHEHEFGISRPAPPWRRVRFDGRSETLRSIHRRNRRRFRAKWHGVATPRKALVSIGSGPQRKLLAISRQTFGPYAERHGYDLVLRTDGLDTTRPPAWAKVKLLRELALDYDVLVWLDCDLMIVDGRADIAAELDDESLLCLVEHDFGDRRMPNSGVMVLRGGERAAAFLDEVWGKEQHVDNTWWENAAICELLGYDLDPPRPVRDTPLLASTRFISPRWNAIRDAPTPRARIRHYPGYSLKTRMAFMLRDLAEARLRRAVGR
jgi:GT2 family glycosyltransferase